MVRSSPTESVLRQDRLVVLAAVAAMAALAWAYMIRAARAMDRTGICECVGMAFGGPDSSPWSAWQLVPLFVMWAEMMVAMMLPSAAPVVLIFARVNRQRREQDRPYLPAGLFLTGYFMVWGAFSLLAALGQWVLHDAALLSSTMKSSSSAFGGWLLIGAGIFQWTPWKRSCLAHCSSPLNFLLGSWREGAMGAVMMGIRHGAYCTGCCWLLMLVLFVAGVMNIWWILALTLLVVLERWVPQATHLSTGVGVVLVGCGLWMLGTGGWS